MVNWIIFGILTLPWICVPINGISDQFRYPKAAWFDFICMGIIVLAFKRGLKFNYINKYLSWFVGYLFFTIILNWYYPLIFSKQGLQFNFYTISPTLHFIFIIFSSYVCLSVLDKEDFLKIAKAICLSSVLVSSFGLLQLLGFDPIGNISRFKPGYQHLTALLDNPDLVGNYLCLTLPFFLLFKEKKYWVGGIISFICLLLCKSSISIFSGIFGILVFLLINFKNKKHSFLISLLFFSSLSFLVYKNFTKILGSFDARIYTWGSTINHIKDNPLFGHGLGVFKYWKIHPPAMFLDLYAHNDYLERMSEIGILGMFLLALVIINSFRNFNYRENKIGVAFLASFLSFLLICFFSFPMEIAPIGFLGLIGWIAIEKL